MLLKLFHRCRAANPGRRSIKTDVNCRSECARGRYPLESAPFACPRINRKTSKSFQEHFPPLDSISSLCPWRRGSLAARKVFLQWSTPGARHALHSRCANHPRSRLAFTTGWDSQMGAWIATNSSIVIRTKASECSSPCSRGLLGSHSSPFTSVSCSGYDLQCTLRYSLWTRDLCRVMISPGS